MSYLSNSPCCCQNGLRLVLMPLLQELLSPGLLFATTAAALKFRLVGVMISMWVAERHDDPDPDSDPKPTIAAVIVSIST